MMPLRLQPAGLALVAGLILATATSAATEKQAATRAEPFPDADLSLGTRLIQEHRCSECHAQRFGGDGSAVYRPEGRINTPSALRAMVQRCDTELGLQLFPEDVEAVAGVLNRQHYRFQSR